MQVLDLESNKLQSLPMEICCLTALQALYLEGNPLSPPLLLRLCVQEVVSFCEHKAEGSQVFFHKQIVLVGNSKVGKTSLRQHLMHQHQGPVGSISLQDRTIGIELSRWFPSVICKDGHDVAIDFWDLAGQEAFYPTHKLFLDLSALFFVVCSLAPRDDEGPAETADQLIREISGWRQFIQARCPDADIVHIATHMDAYDNDSDAFDSLIDSIGMRLFCITCMTREDPEDAGIANLVEEIEKHLSSGVEFPKEDLDVEMRVMAHHANIMLPPKIKLQARRNHIDTTKFKSYDKTEYSKSPVVTLEEFCSLFWNGSTTCSEDACKIVRVLELRGTVLLLNDNIFLDPQ
jgi:GTPase SAR1 family protein